MAAWLIDQCIRESERGEGGFATMDISRLTTYVTEPDTKIDGTYREWAHAKFLALKALS